MRNTKVRRVQHGDRVGESGEGDVQLVAVRSDREVDDRSDECY